MNAIFLKTAKRVLFRVFPKYYPKSIFLFGSGDFVKENFVFFVLRKVKKLKTPGEKIILKYQKKKVAQDKKDKDSHPRYRLV